MSVTEVPHLEETSLAQINEVIETKLSGCPHAQVLARTLQSSVIQQDGIGGIVYPGQFLYGEGWDRGSWEMRIEGPSLELVGIPNKREVVAAMKLMVFLGDEDSEKLAHLYMFSLGQYVLDGEPLDIKDLDRVRKLGWNQSCPRIESVDRVRRFHNDHGYIAVTQLASQAIPIRIANYKGEIKTFSTYDQWLLGKVLPNLSKYSARLRQERELIDPLA